MKIDEFLIEYAALNPKQNQNNIWGMIRVPQMKSNGNFRYDCPITALANAKRLSKTGCKYSCMEAEMAGLALGLCKDDIYTIINAADSPYTEHKELRSKLLSIGALV